MPLESSSRVQDFFAHTALHRSAFLLVRNYFLVLSDLSRIGLREGWLEVDLSVPQQLRLFPERFVAEIAGPAAHFLVDCDDVSVETRLLPEGFVADLADVVSDLLMNHLSVRSQVDEDFITNAALLGSFDAVSSQVRVEVASRSEILVAIRAMKRIARLIVDPLVLQQIDFRLVVLGAFIAEPRSVVSMMRQMVLEVGNI